MEKRKRRERERQSERERERNKIKEKLTGKRQSEEYNKKEKENCSAIKIHQSKVSKRAGDPIAQCLRLTNDSNSNQNIYMIALCAINLSMMHLTSP